MGIDSGHCLSKHQNNVVNPKRIFLSSSLIPLHQIPLLLRIHQNMSHEHHENEMCITWKVIVRKTCFCEKILADFTVSWAFQKYFNFVPMLESRNVDHMKGNCSWDMIFWINSGGLHTFMSFSKIFQLCTHAKIT